VPDRIVHGMAVRRLRAWNLKSHPVLLGLTPRIFIQLWSTVLHRLELLPFLHIIHGHVSCHYVRYSSFPSDLSRTSVALHLFANKTHAPQVRWLPSDSTTRYSRFRSDLFYHLVIRYANYHSPIPADYLICHFLFRAHCATFKHIDHSLACFPNFQTSAVSHPWI
jgi:hypothetical protein